MDGLVTGAALELVSGPDSHLQNGLETITIGSALSYVQERYGSKLPFVNVKLPVVEVPYIAECKSNWDVVKDRLPYAVAGFMAGQTLARLLKL
ncbi:hypothetical protein HYY73_02425 [Candidatus Woesearchaeota archaeon]|nr:hypothetical protein [Candidatus Woesearchaeota archaeon]